MQAKDKLKGTAINVAHGERHDLITVKKLIEKYTGKKLTLEHRPTRLGDVRHTQADIDLAKKLLGYASRVNFEEGLRRTMDWFEKREKA